ncbi:DUF106 domain-containing protein [Haloarchaeobius sp. DFWS5]|uniref:DUF106 domain-containing protein n=1 Tax=Haloarchaeobius sp. DFWS5 TaxID=3446114 RepID=UPI003EBDCC58
MTWTADDATSFLKDHPDMVEPLTVVVDESNGGERPIEWKDVKDEDGMDSGAWGRLIQTDALEERENGFALTDADAVEEALERNRTASSEPTVDDEGDDDADDSSWRTADKVAGLVSLTLMTGYYFEPIRDTVGSTIDVVFQPLNAVMPFYAVILAIALVTGLYTTLLQANMVDQSKIKGVQQKMQDLTKREKAAKERDDEAALEKIQEEKMAALGDQGEMMKENFRPMAWIMLLTIPAFLWMYWMIRDGHLDTAVEGSFIVPIFGEHGWRDPLVGPMPAWIVWYFLCSMGFNQLLRKTLDMDATPT